MRVRLLHPFRIEGERQTKPGVDICYSVKTAHPLKVSGCSDLRAFVRTRDRTMALTGLMLELTGPGVRFADFQSQ